MRPKSTGWKRLAGLGTLLLWLTLSTGCSATRPSLSKPAWPQPGPRKAEALAHPKSGEQGVWEPAWSAANGVKYTLQLEKRNQECDLIIDALGK
ncbi:MAG: hypothetical protein ACOZF2_07390 [Thermodesulfobacteriota bacterium]